MSTASSPQHKKPWLPTPYLAEGIALSMTMMLPVVMYRQLGMTGGEITIFLALMNLPWVIRPIWHQRFAALGCRRWWSLVLQMVLALVFGALAFAMQTRSWLVASMVLLWVAAFATAALGDANETLFALSAPPERTYHYNKLRAVAYGLSLALVLGVMIMVVGNLQVIYRNSIRYSWSITLYGATGLFVFLWLFHLYAMPRVTKQRKSKGSNRPTRAAATSIHSFLHSPHLKSASVFLLLYPLPAGLLHRSTELFLIDNAGNGGLALSPQEFGLAWGTIGVVALLLGILAGSALIRKFGLRPMLLPMAVVMALPDLSLLWLSTDLPFSLAAVSLAIIVCQLTLGVAVSPYLHFAAHYGHSEEQIAPNVVCVALGALGMMVGSMVSGTMQESLGYPGFYKAATAIVATSVVASLLVWRAAAMPCFSHGRRQNHSGKLGE